jgi:hypothetical protein
MTSMRCDWQRNLLAAGQQRFTPIQVNEDGIIWDGHHAVREAAEQGAMVDVLVVAQPLKPVGLLILDLPVR